MSSPLDDLRHAIEDLPPQLAGEVLDFVAFVRARHGLPSGPTADDRAWVETNAADLGDRLSALEAEESPERLADWMQAMDEGATAVTWDETARAFVEVQD